MAHIFHSVPCFDPCPLTHLKCYQGSPLLFSQFIILLCFKENWKLTSSSIQRTSNTYSTVWLQIIYFQFSTLHQQIYLFNILHSPYYKHYAPLYSGVMLDKGDLHLGNQRGPIISWETHLLWSVFHCCLLFASTCVYRIWWSAFHGPSQLGEERKENPALTPQRWCVQRKGMKGKLKWFQCLLLLFWL